MYRLERILRDLDIWRRIPPGKVSLNRRAKVINGGSSRALHFDHRETGKVYFGAIVAIYLLRRAAFAANQEVA